jgi:hypothetical protein
MKGGYPTATDRRLSLDFFFSFPRRTFWDFDELIWGSDLGGEFAERSGKGLSCFVFFLGGVWSALSNWRLCFSLLCCLSCSVSNP